QTPNCRPPSPHSSRCSLTGPDFQRAAKKPITVTSAKKKTKIQSATQSIAAMTLLPALLLGLVRRSAAIDQPDQQRGDRYPGELVPIEEGKAEQRGLQEIVERHPQQADKRDQQRTHNGGLQFSPALLGRPCFLETFSEPECCSPTGFTVVAAHCFNN